MSNFLISVLQRIMQAIIVVVTFSGFLIMSAFFTKYVIGMNSYGAIYFTVAALSLILVVWVLISESDTTNIYEYGFRPMNYFLLCILLGVCATVIIPIIISAGIIILYFLLSIISCIFA